MSTGTEREIAATIVELSRERAAIAPAPRTEPHFAMDHASGTRLTALDDLAVRGIFRKYERVLDLGAGLGAASRWLAARFGCEAIGLVGSENEAAANALLSRRSPFAHAVHVVAGSAHALPFRHATFTHVWSIEALARCEPLDLVLREAHRVVRPGGWLAIQEIVGRETDDGLRAAVTAAGFVDAELRDATAAAVGDAAASAAARAQLHGRLRARGGRLAGFVERREATSEAIRAGRCRIVQIVARRPA